MEESDDPLGTLLSPPSAIRNPTVGMLLLVAFILIGSGAYALYRQNTVEARIRSILEPEPLPPLPASTVQTSSQSGKTSNLPGRISINTASSESLQELPDIGPARAERIIQNRPYTTIHELKDRGVVSSSLYEQILPSISL